MKLSKAITRAACAIVLALVLGSFVLGVVAVVYGLATDCPGTAGVYVKCSR